MKFDEWFNSEPHRAKYSSNHPAYLAAQEAWTEAHKECAKLCWELANDMTMYPQWGANTCGTAIMAKGQE